MIKRQCNLLFYRYNFSKSGITFYDMIILLSAYDKKRFSAHAKIFFPFRCCNSILMESQPPAICTSRSNPALTWFAIWLFLGILLDPSVSGRFNKRFLCILYVIIAISRLWWIIKAELQRLWRETIKERICLSLRYFRATFSSCCVQFHFLILITLQHLQLIDI